MFELQMTDVISNIVTPITVRSIVVYTDALSALMIGFLAFAATGDAGVKSPVALLRLLHRFAMVALSLSLAYHSALVLQNNIMPTGAAMMISLSIFFSTMLSGIRHVLAPSIPKDASWGKTKLHVVDHLVHRGHYYDVKQPTVS